MQNYYPRKLEQLVTKYLSQFPVVGITGPGQSGKTTIYLLQPQVNDQFQDSI